MARMSARDAQRLALELQRARDLQTAFINRGTVTLRDMAECALLFEPAYELSGDFVDCLALEDGRLGLCIADVRGHGVPAAMEQALVRAIFHAVAPCHSAPAPVLREMNRMLYSELEPEAFVTALYAVLDTNRRRLSVARAGHEPLLVAMRAGAVKVIEPDGMGLAMDEGPVFDEVLCQVDLEVEEGDVLALYTDGVSETYAPTGQVFGGRRLAELLDQPDQPLVELVTAVSSALETHRGSRSQEDDMTLLLMRVPPAPR